MPSSDRIPRQTEPSFCTNCNTSYESARALRNHRRYCLTVLNGEDVEMEEPSITHPSPPSEPQITASFSEQPSQWGNDDGAMMMDDDGGAMIMDDHDGAMIMDDIADATAVEDANIAETQENGDVSIASNNIAVSKSKLAMIDTNQERPEFDLLSVKYKTVGTLDENSTDQAIFYDCSSLETIDENTYTTTELLSIELYDIANDFTISRDAYRKLVRLMNTVLRDTEKISRESNPRILHGPQVQSMLQKQSSLIAHKYDVCVNGCKLYSLGTDDDKTSCEFCFHERYDTRRGNQPISTMKVMSIGDIVSRLIANPVIREELRYRHVYDERRQQEETLPDDIVVADVFDGATYKSMKHTHFTNELDVAVSIMNDGFVVEKRGDQLFTIVHLIIFNYDPLKRYKEEYMHELCIFPGKKKPKSFDSFISVILAELQWLSTYGMMVETADAGPICLRVHPLVAGGDTPAVFDWSKCAHHASSHGCRFCFAQGCHPDNRSHGMYFPNPEHLRTNADYQRADPNLGYNGISLFNQLSSCIAPQCFGFEEMHTLARGIGSELFQILTVDLSSDNTKFFYTNAENEFEQENYPFFIPKSRLLLIGKAIEETRFNIPVAFDGSFLNIIEKLRGTRSVDYLDNLLTIIPTLFVPELADPDAQQAIMKLVRGVCLALQWEFTEAMLVEIDECISHFHNYCKQQRDNMRLSLSVFRPVMHQLTHVVWMIREMGPIVAYSSRSQERSVSTAIYICLVHTQLLTQRHRPFCRSIGKFSELITGKTRIDKQSSNLIEIVAIRNQLKRVFNSNDFLQGIRPEPYSSASYINHPQALTTSQLWDPYQSETSLQPQAVSDNTNAEFHGVPVFRFRRALSKFYCRIFSLSRLDIPLSLTFTAAHRALIGSTLIGSEIYREKMHEYRRSNHYVMFRSTHLNRFSRPISCWFVARVLFFFQHVYNGTTYFLAFVETMKEHGVAAHDKSVPYVRMNEPVEQQVSRRVPRIIDPKYAVISIDDVEMQVGLVKSLDNDRHFYIIANYHAFEQDMSLNAGDIRNL